MTKSFTSEMSEVGRFKERDQRWVTGDGVVDSAAAMAATSASPSEFREDIDGKMLMAERIRFAGRSLISVCLS